MLAPSYLQRLFSMAVAIALASLLGGCSAMKILDGELPDLLTEKDPVHTRPYPVKHQVRADVDHASDPERTAAKNKREAAARKAAPPTPTATPTAAKATKPVPPPAPVENKSAENNAAEVAPKTTAPIPINTPTLMVAPLTPATDATKQIPVAKLIPAEVPATPAPAAPVAPAESPASSPTQLTVAQASAEKPIELLTPAAKPEATPKPTSEEKAPASETEDIESLSPAERHVRWQRDRDTLITALQEELRTRREKDARDPELAIMEQELRLLQLSAGNVEGAAEKIDALPAAEQEAFRHLMYGLSTWQSREEGNRPILRNAKIQRALRDAAHELAKTSKLDLRNLTFCESVESFGWFTEFPRRTFKPGEEVILYLEVENFAAEARSKKEFETELQGSYQIYDSAGRMVAERILPLDKETCRNFRRDYFLAYLINIPKNISAGKYRLELTVEDMKAQDHAKGSKFGTAVIEFTVAE